MCQLNWRYLKPYIKLNLNNLAFLIKQQFFFKKNCVVDSFRIFTGLRDLYLEEGGGGVGGRGGLYFSQFYSFEVPAFQGIKIQCYAVHVLADPPAP